MRVSTFIGRLSRHPLVVALFLFAIAAVAYAANDITLLDSTGATKTICTDEVNGRHFYCFKIYSADPGSGTGANVNANHELLVKQTDAVSVTGSSVAVSSIPEIPAGANDIGTVHTVPPTASATVNYTVVRCTDGTIYEDCGGGGGGGGTSSNLGSAVPVPATGMGASDGTDMQMPRVHDGDTTGGTEYNLGVVLRQSGAAGTVELGTAAVPLRVDTTGTTAQPTDGTIAHDSADSGNPLKVGCRARTSDITPVQNDDRADCIASIDGPILVQPYGLESNLVSGCGNTAGAGDTQIIATPGGTRRLYITRLTVFNTSATNAYISIKSAATAIDEAPAPANYGGAVIAYGAPLRLAPNEALNFATLPAGVTTMRVCASGYSAAN